MDGTELQRLREARGMTQKECADWLNDQLGRRYDKARISRWEGNSEAIPQRVDAFLREVTAPSPASWRNRLATGCCVVAVANQKGGVGKTTTTVNLASALRAASQRVLLLDADPQASATI